MAPKYVEHEQAVEDMTADLIKVNLMNLVQWVGIRGEHLSPFQRAIAELAAKYDVPSPFDTDALDGEGTTSASV